MTLLLLLAACPRPGPALEGPGAARDACEGFERAAGQARSARALDERPPEGLALPEDLQGAVAFVERAGWLLHAEDRAAARAREVLSPALARDPRLSPGWLVAPHEGALEVHFFGELEGEPRSLYRARYDPLTERLLSLDPPASALAQGPPEPQPMAPELQHMARALRVASLADFPLHPGGVRTVVLPFPSARGEGWMVYFLATEAVPDEVSVGGHVAVWVDLPGERVLQVTRHGEAPQRHPRPGPGDPLPRVAHDQTDFPLETHVYTSLTYDLPLCVQTPRGWWAVAGRHVRWLGPM